MTRTVPPQSFTEIAYSTVQITCYTSDGSQSTGTGFFYLADKRKLDDDRQGAFVPLIITNKHVIKDAVRGEMTLTTCDDNGNPIDGAHIIVDINNFDYTWTPHPDDSVDLCAMPFAYIDHTIKAQGVNIFYKAVDKEATPTEEELEHLDALENIITIGYPNGLSDTTNNRPIFRRGVTATSINLNYCGRPEFLIDCAVFPGSSGSPVFIADTNGYRYKGQVVLGERLLLVGIVYAVFQHNAMGKIVPLPINQIPLGTLTSIPNHLGLVIRFDKLFEFDRIFAMPDQLP